ncbi:MAG: rhomboid family intramembrane serine protease [Acidimicrobiia bacterium]
MFPLKDNIPTERAPVVTIALIVANVLAYFLLQRGGWEITSLTAGEWSRAQEAAYPCDLVDRCPSGEPPPGHVAAPVSVLTSMFMHGSLLHLGGNMLFLWIFGNNIEDHMGAVPYVLFYLISGLAAAAAHVMVQPDSTIPVVGASGAVAGVMGAYLVLFPNVPIRTLFLFLLIFLRDIAAKWLLGFWFLLQFFTSPDEGVAWVAHVGGFVFGALVALLFRERLRRPTVPASEFPY